MSNYVLQWESPRLGYYWNHNFIHQVYAKKHLANLLGFQDENFIADCNNSIYSFYLHKDTLENSINRSREFFNSKQLVVKWIRNVFAIRSRINELPWSTPNSINQLIDYIEKIENIFHYSVALHLVSQPHITKVLEIDLVNFCNQHSIDLELISKITMPVKISAIMEEQLEWYLLVKESHKKRNQLSDLLDIHLNKWRYITAGDSRSPMTREYLFGRFSNDIGHLDKIITQIDHLQLLKSGSFGKEVNLIYKTLPDRVVATAKTISAISYIRFITKQSWMKLWYLLEQSLGKLSEHYQYSLDDWVLEEIKSKEFMNSNNNRANYLYHYSDNVIKLYYNQTDEQHRNFLLGNVNYQEMMNVYGETGYKGKVVGRVLNINWNDDITKKSSLITSKTILVAPQTTPAYVGLLTQCIGLITDEGGITGHSSIISRELKLPSLIGTKIATKVFDDGEFIELDATNGRAIKIREIPE